jgi:ketosteroid isomerase-like protein
MKAALLAGALLAACTGMTTEAPDPVHEVAAAERAFAAESVRTDMRAAFLANFAPGGMMVSGGWVDAHALLGPRAAPPIVLDWRPWHVEAAASGELALSTGPWKRKPRAAEGAVAHGQFVSIWRRQQDGRWKVEVDLGISHPQPWAAQGSDDFIPAPAPAAQAGTRLQEAEAAFVKTSMLEGPRAAYAAHASERVLLYRDGHAPMRGRAAALESSAPPEVPTTWFAERIVVARSDDFAYVRGYYTDRPDPGHVRGYFLRVWRREAGTWHIVMDVANPAS